MIDNNVKVFENEDGAIIFIFPKCADSDDIVTVAKRINFTGAYTMEDGRAAVIVAAPP